MSDFLIKKDAIEGSYYLASYRGKEKTVIVPDNITAIDDGAFSNCTFIEEIILPKFLCYIGEAAFEHCENLTNIDIPDGIIKIETATFQGCKSLKEITLPDTLKEIGWVAFDSCLSLESIVLPQSLTKLTAGAFNLCENLRSISIPKKVSKIGNGVFYGCTKLETISVDTNNKKYESEDNVLFAKGKSMLVKAASCKEGEYPIPEGVTVIDKYAFESCSRLKSIVIPETVTEIGEGAFCNCRSLEYIKIPASVKKIGFSALEGCTNLRIIENNTCITKHLTSEMPLVSCRFPDEEFKGFSSFQRRIFTKCYLKDKATYTPEEQERYDDYLRRQNAKILLELIEANDTETIARLLSLGFTKIDTVKKAINKAVGKTEIMAVLLDYQNKIIVLNRNYLTVRSDLIL